ncbi:AAA family ATPase [Candidatus Marsarchaeota archaeon]|nr:AAA family ATPase [Candidatus Marsarchaeota archaeon]
MKVTKSQAQGGKNRVSEREIARNRRYLPLFAYGLMSRVEGLLYSGNLIDAILAVIAFVALDVALPFYPIAIAVVLTIAIFAATRYRAFLGLIALTVFSFPMFIYQTPALSWLFIIAASISLIYGYMHHRTILFLYMMFSAAFSVIGLALSVPILVFAALLNGYKRAAIMVVLFVALVAIFSGITGLQNYSYVLYNAHSPKTTSFQFQNETLTHKQTVPLLDFSKEAKLDAISLESNLGTTEVSAVSGYALFRAVRDVEYYLPEAAAMALAVILIDQLSTKSRRRYRGTIASSAGILYPVSFVILAKLSGTAIGLQGIIEPFISFVLALVAVSVAEYYDIDVVKALRMRQQDVRMKFGDAFESLDNIESQHFKDIANYEYTKNELKQTIIDPMEMKSYSQVYGVMPAKGVLFFGPPGVGKTLMMRALANEIHANFYYVKAQNIISMFTGESEKVVQRIFETAQKNAPCVLFFDEFDAIGSKREDTYDETRKAVLSSLLTAIDGFEKTKGVLLAASTNVPNLLDEAFRRPGRFDKIVYMHLPDFEGRKKLFAHFLEKMPVAKSVNIDELAEKTERYSPADLKGICQSVGQMKMQEAVKKKLILEITQDDLLGVIAATRPSTTLSQVDMYNKFEIDFQRMLNKDVPVEKKETIGLKDVVGLDDAKKAIKDALQIPLLHPELMKKYDVKTINGLLLFGPPGVGKTMLMKAVLNDYDGIVMQELNGARMIELGQEKAMAEIKEVFNRARENQPSIIFLDEIDSIAPNRKYAGEFGVQVTSELLKQIDGLKETVGVIVIGTTNRPDALDPAMLRAGRLDKIIFIRPPNDKQREALFRMYLGKAPLAQDIDFEKIGEETRGYTGADIFNACREIKLEAINASMSKETEVPVSMAIIERVVKSIKPSAPDLAISQYLSFLARYGER